MFLKNSFMTSLQKNPFRRGGSVGKHFTFSCMKYRHEYLYLMWDNVKMHLFIFPLEWGANNTWIFVFFSKECCTCTLFICFVFLWRIYNSKQSMLWKRGPICRDNSLWTYIKYVFWQAQACVLGSLSSKWSCQHYSRQTARWWR